MKTDDMWRAEFEKLIEESIIDRYDGTLEHLDVGVHRPLEEEYVRELLVDMWGDALKQKQIDDRFECLMRYHDEWPHGECEQCEDERPFSDFYTEEDHAHDAAEAAQQAQINAELGIFDAA